MGEGGTILRFDGSAWSTQASPLPVNLNSVWESDSRNAWAVGDGGTVLRWDGATWSAQPSPTAVNLYAVWGSDASSVAALSKSSRRFGAPEAVLTCHSELIWPLDCGSDEPRHRQTAAGQIRIG